MTAPVVVVGAGMGGLSAALDLAASGIEVVLIERAAAPGGKVHQTVVDGRPIDSGPTVFTMRWVFEALFEAAGLDLSDHVALSESSLLARHSWPDGSRLDLHADVERSVAAIDTFASSADGAAYRAFAHRAAEIFGTLDHSFMRRDKPNALQLSLSLGLSGLPKLYRTRPFVSLWRELGRRFEDPRLRQLFARYATYCGSSPFQSPATLMLIAHAERAGVWRVEGGMQALARAMAGAAERAGAALRFGEAVARIDPRERGFTVTSESGEVTQASSVVFNGDVAALSQGLLGQAVIDALPDRHAETRSLSAITWSVVAPVSDFPLAHHSVFFGQDYADEFSAVFERQAVSASPTVYVCAQDRGDDCSMTGPERLLVLINAPPDELSSDAIAKAQSAAERLLDVQGFHLSLDDETAVRATPQDFARRFPASSGAIYGWPTHGWSGTFRRAGAATRIPGLFCAGGTVHPGPGIPMATLSGRIAANRVRRYIGASGRKR